MANKTTITPYDRTVAYHESGHVLGGRLGGAEILSATIEPSRHYDGQVRHGFMKYEDSIISHMLGHAVELEFGMGDDLYYYSSDYEKAKRECRELCRVKRGLSVDDRCKTRRWQFSGYQPWKEHQRKLRVPKSEWKPLYDRLWRKARRLAKKHRAYIEHVAGLLMLRGTLTDNMIPQLGEVSND